jgi:hypothetical protein
MLWRHCKAAAALKCGADHISHNQLFDKLPRRVFATNPHRHVYYHKRCLVFCVNVSQVILLGCACKYCARVIRAKTPCQGALACSSLRVSICPDLLFGVLPVQVFKGFDAFFLPLVHLLLGHIGRNLLLFALMIDIRGSNLSL